MKMLSEKVVDVQQEVAVLLRRLLQQLNKVAQHVEAKSEDRKLLVLLNHNKLVLQLAEAVDNKRCLHFLKIIVLNRQHKELLLVRVRAGTKRLHSKDRHKIHSKDQHNKILNKVKHSNPPRDATNRQLHHRQDQAVSLVAPHQDNNSQETLANKTFQDRHREAVTNLQHHLQAMFRDRHQVAVHQDQVAEHRQAEVHREAVVVVAEQGDNTVGAV